jgi:ribosome biogenesis GTPase
LGATLTGVVVAAHGRHYLVELADRSTVLCHPRGKKSLLACGDRVGVELAAPGQGVVTGIEPRRTLLYRSDIYRHKLIAANATQIIVVVAVEPSFSTELISRCLVAAAQQSMAALLVLNKIDLEYGLEQARAQLRAFANAGYPVVELSARRDVRALQPRLANHLSVLVGQSGMGKSTLINALVPGSSAATREISTALDTGRHTTTLSRLYRLDDTSGIVDSPGLQEFGLAHLAAADLEAGFVEFRPYLGHCRFRNCRHDTEPDCALLRAAESGAIEPLRLQHFHSIRRAAGESVRR